MFHIFEKNKYIFINLDKFYFLTIKKNICSSIKTFAIYEHVNNHLTDLLCLEDTISFESQHCKNLTSGICRRRRTGIVNLIKRE